MNPLSLFIHRPVFTSLLMLAIALAGVLGWRSLPVASLPNIDFPTIVVSASLPGAPPEVVASTVTTPLEKAFSGIAGVEQISSSSSQGSSRITLTFRLDRAIDAAANDVQTALSAASRRLPKDMPAPPSLRKSNPTDLPVFYLALQSEALSATALTELAETRLAQQLSTLPGVAQVNLFGSRKYAVRVQLSPERLAGHGIGFDDVSRAINDYSSRLSAGNADVAGRSLALGQVGLPASADSFRRLPVQWKNGAPLRLEALGQVLDSVEDDKAMAKLNGQPALVLAIERQPGSNAIALSDAVRATLPKLTTQLPAAVSWRVLYDRADSIRASLHEVELTLLLAFALVALTIFLFLKYLSTTLIPVLALPLSLLATLAAMPAFGFSVDNLSLLAFTLAVGFVVDDAIVVLENIARHREMGKPALQAALDGSREIVFTVLSMTLSLAAVFIPLLLMGGVLGRLLNEFAVVIVLAILASALVSLTLTPMLSARWLTHTTAPRPHWLHNAFEYIWQALAQAYRRSLDWSLRRPWLNALLFLLCLVGSGLLFTQLPKGLLPNEDTGQITANTEAASDIAFPQMLALQDQAVAIIRRHPAVYTVMSSISGGSNQGRMFIRLKSGQRADADTVIKQLRPQLNQLTNLKVFVQNVPLLRIGGISGKSPYQFVLQGSDNASLYHWAAQLEAALRRERTLTAISSSLENSRPELQLQVDHERAGQLGVSNAAIQNALAAALSGRDIATLYSDNNQYPIIVEAEPGWQQNMQRLQQLPVKSASGHLLPLANIARLEFTSGPQTINHLAQLPTVTLSFDLAAGRSLSDAVSAIDRSQRQLGLPADIQGSFQGTAQAFEQSFGNIGWLLLLAVVVIYLVLGMLYESTLHPLTILSGLPSAGLGALLALWLAGRELDLYGFVGLILLIGIVKKNAIMMIDFALAAQKTGCSAADAIRSACLTRFRPIMMTTVAALLGILPIAVGVGASGSARQSLGLAVVGGLLVSQWLTLYLTPAVYLALERLRSRIRLH